MAIMSLCHLSQGRRAVAVRVIDERLGRAKEGHFYERKIALLTKEDEIEADFEKQVCSEVINLLLLLICFLHRPMLQ